MSGGESTFNVAEAAEAAAALLGGLASSVRSLRGRVVIELTPAALPEVAAKLHDDGSLDYKYLSFAGGVDYLSRMEAVYLLRSSAHGVVTELRVALDREDPVVPTVSNIWSTAQWHERETYDLLGIQYEGHPDLRRILTRGDDGVFPLRKDARPHRVSRDEWRFEGVAPAKRLPGEEKRTERS